jgi:hypothetical protein
LSPGFGGDVLILNEQSCELARRETDIGRLEGLPESCKLDCLVLAGLPELSAELPETGKILERLLVPALIDLPEPSASFKAIGRQLEGTNPQVARDKKPRCTRVPSSGNRPATDFIPGDGIQFTTQLKLSASFRDRLGEQSTLICGATFTDLSIDSCNLLGCAGISDQGEKGSRCPPAKGLVLGDYLGLDVQRLPKVLDALLSRKSRDFIGIDLSGLDRGCGFFARFAAFACRIDRSPCCQCCRRDCCHSKVP